MLIDNRLLQLYYFCNCSSGSDHRSSCHMDRPAPHRDQFYDIGLLASSSGGFRIHEIQYKWPS